MNMIGGIASLVQGEREKRLRVTTRMWLAHTAGGVIGGAAMAAALWLVFTPLRTLPPELFVVSVFVVLAAAALLAELERLGLPRQARQVPQLWSRRYGPSGSYALYGLWLGAGLATNVTYTVEYVAFFAAALFLSLPSALIAGAAFGLGRTALIGPIGMIPRAALWWSRRYSTGMRARAVLGCVLTLVAVAGVLLIGT